MKCCKVEMAKKILGAKSFGCAKLVCEKCGSTIYLRVDSKELPQDKQSSRVRLL